MTFQLIALVSSAWLAEEMIMSATLGKPDVIDYLFSGFLGFMFFVILGGIALGVAHMIGEMLTTTRKKDKRFDLVALQDGRGLDGSFFLGSGSINTNLYYFFYRKYKGGFIGDKISAKKIIIFQDEEKEPYIQKYKAKFKGKLHWLIAFPPQEKTEIHIPRGSIKEGFTLDLK